MRLETQGQAVLASLSKGFEAQESGSRSTWKKGGSGWGTPSEWAWRWGGEQGSVSLKGRSLRGRVADRGLSVAIL